MGKLIVAIGREYGSGGREIGEKLANRLGIKFFDKELLTLVAKESGYCEEILQKNDEQPTNSFSLLTGDGYLCFKWLCSFKSFYRAAVKS